MSVKLQFELSSDEMMKNYQKLIAQIPIMFESRANKLERMYKDMEDNIIMAPASSIEHFHNAFPGGYVDHVLRVLEFSFHVYKTWIACGIDVSDFTPEELAFVAIHHDLGKIGLPGENSSRYVWNDSEWHRKNQGRIYEANPNIPYMLVPDMALFLLQKYEIPLTMNETLGIKLTDGLYDDANKAYYISNTHKSGLRTFLPYIVHQADLMATKFEYTRWAQSSGDGLKKYKG